MGLAVIETARVSKLGAVIKHKVECEVVNGIGIHIVGLHDTAVRESLLRVCTALQASGFHIPGRKIVVNVTPKVTVDEGFAKEFDLAIALALIDASEQVKFKNLDKLIAIGELALDGSLRYVRNGASFADLLTEDKDKKLVLPAESALETFYKSGESVHAVSSLAQALAVAQGLDCYNLYESEAWEQALERVQEWKNERKKLVFITDAHDCVTKAPAAVMMGDHVLRVLFLGENNKLLGSDAYYGGFWHSAFNANKKDVIADAASYEGIRGIAMVLTRNEGGPAPDDNDIKQIEEFKKTLAAFQINLVDVIISADGHFFSCAEDSMYVL